MKLNAIGVVEVNYFTNSVVVLDEMLKASDVKLVSIHKKLGGRMVHSVIAGETSAVNAAIEAADVVLMTDEPSKLVSAIKIAKRTKSIVWENIIFAFAVKALVLLLGAGGIATMWEAVFADVGVALLAVLNAMRVMRVKNI